MHDARPTKSFRPRFAAAGKSTGPEVGAPASDTDLLLLRPAATNRSNGEFLAVRAASYSAMALAVFVYALDTAARLASSMQSNASANGSAASPAWQPIVFPGLPRTGKGGQQTVAVAVALGTSRHVAGHTPAC